MALIHEQELTRARLILGTVGIMVALLLAALDQTIVGTALPRIVAELRGLDLYAWVITAYMVASTTTVPIAGKLGDLFGRKRLLLAGMIGFVLASALCGQAQDMAQLIAFRAVQGIFAGTLLATVFASIADLYPPRERPRVQGLFAGMWGLASLIGPVVGGFLTDEVGWRWVFYVNVPVGLAAIAFVGLTMSAGTSRGTRHDIDFPGAGLLVAGLVPLLVALSMTRDHAWSSPEVLGLLGVAAISLVAFFLREGKAREPIVPFELFRNRTFSVAMATGFLVTFGMFGTIGFVPLFYQGVLGIAPTNSGLLLTPMMAGVVAASVVSGQLMTRIQRYRYIGTVGIALATTGLALLSQATATSSEVEVVRDLVMIGAGVGLTFPLYINAVQSALPRELTGVVTSQAQFFRNVGGTIGIAVLGSVLSARLPDRVRDATASLPLPAGAPSLVGGADPQTLFEPARIAALRATLPPQAQTVFDQLLDALRVALATTLQELFLYGAMVVAVGVVASLFLAEVPLRGRERRAERAAPAVAFGK